LSPERGVGLHPLEGKAIGLVDNSFSTGRSSVEKTAGAVSC
jgi:hypothetical protein